jgi:hypothetical protein
MAVSDITSEGQSIVRQFADFWRSLPELNSPLFVIVCLRTEDAVLGGSDIETIKKCVRFDERLWGSLLPELETLPPNYLETVDRHPLFLRTIAGREHNLAHFHAKFELLAKLQASVRLRALEEFLSGNQHSGSV